ncbi:MAG: 2Fe-2S ferredoxin [Candidatus Azotimanducaceae bacterium]
MIRVEPTGVSFEVNEDETIMAAAIRNGYTWPTICGGQGTCKTCVFLTLEGESNLAEIEPWEKTALDSITDTLPDKGQGWRLACQAKAIGDVRLKKIGVRLA